MLMKSKTLIAGEGEYFAVVSLNSAYELLREAHRQPNRLTEEMQLLWREKKKKHKFNSSTNSK